MKSVGAILQLETAFNKGNAIGYKIKKVNASKIVLSDVTNQ